MLGGPAGSETSSRECLVEGLSIWWTGAGSSTHCQALLWVQGLVCRLELGEVEMGADLSEEDLRPLLVYCRHRVPRAPATHD